MNKNQKIDALNRSKKFSRAILARPRATIFRDKTKYHRPAVKQELRKEIDEE